MKSGNLNFLEHSGPLQACNGTDLPLPSEQETLDISKDIGLWATSVPKETSYCSQLSHTKYRHQPWGKDSTVTVVMHFVWRNVTWMLGCAVTIDVTDRHIRTGQWCERRRVVWLAMTDRRGTHDKQVTVADAVKVVSTKTATIPVTVSLYIGANISKYYWDGGQILTELYRDCKAQCGQAKKPYMSCVTYWQILNYAFNFQIFKPKKMGITKKNNNEEGKGGKKLN